MKNLMLISALGLSIMVGSTVQSVAASDHAKGPRHSFEDLDANGDGRLTRAEMDAHMQERFARADSNGDGVLTQAEMEARGKERMAKRAAKMIERLDKNGDNGISFDEMKAGRGGKMFERADADGDGAITKAEFEEVRAEMRNAHKQRKDEAGD